MDDRLIKYKNKRGSLIKCQKPSFGTENVSKSVDDGFTKIFILIN